MHFSWERLRQRLKNLRGLKRVEAFFLDCAVGSLIPPTARVRTRVVAPFHGLNLKERLTNLAASEKPTDLAMGAMCYKMACPTGTTDIFCTFCNKKTVVKKDWNTKRLNDCLRLVQAINNAKRKLEVKLDNRFYCAYCNPSIKANPQKDKDGSVKLPALKPFGCAHVDDKTIDGLYLIIKYADEKEVRRVSITFDGLKMLTAFVQGKDRTAGLTGSETALKENVKDPQIHIGHRIIFRYFRGSRNSSSQLSVNWCSNLLFSIR